MNLYSTKNPDFQVDIQRAVLEGLPPDNGLYMLEKINKLPDAFSQQAEIMSFSEMAFEVAKTLLDGSIPEDTLRRLVDASITFDAPLGKVEEDLYSLELWHGPTLAFKDFGARFMAQMMGYFVQQDDEDLHILVATSGDTGGAVASGFYKTPGIRVTILYPSGKVSELQEKQLTTLGHNIHALEVNGSFDDCQALVKQAFLDQTLKGKVRLSSANSINIARLIPQTFYYFRAWVQATQRRPFGSGQAKPLVVCVPSGNFGNLTAGLIAKKMGLPIAHFIAATNANDVVPEYLETALYSPRPSVPTISNAMDVGAPSNFARMMDLYQNDWEAIIQDISGYRYSDEATREALVEVKARTGYLMDPHGAVGYLALKAWKKKNPGHIGIFLETAHPSKFLDVVEPAINEKVPVPERLARLAAKQKEAIWLENDYQALKAYLLNQ
jgi:threonine synthase